MIDNVGKAGKEYIKWAKNNNYKVWAMISNNSMPQTTSEIMRDYRLREKLIDKIVNLAYEYKLDGINIDFENMYEEDKKLFSRFIIGWFTPLCPYFNLYILAPEAKAKS